MRDLTYISFLLLSIAPVVACSSTTRNNIQGDDTGAAGETSTSSSSSGDLSAGGSGGSGDGGSGGSADSSGTGGASSGDNSSGGTSDSTNGGAGGSGGGTGGSAGGTTDSTTSAGSGGSGGSTGGSAGGTTDSTTSAGSGGSGGGTTDSSSTTSGGSGGGTATSTTDSTTSAGSGGSGGGTTDSSSTTSGGSGGGTATSTTGSSCAGSACTSECPCSTGEGACSNDDECVAGLVCTTAAVAKLGFTGGTKSCMLAHCDNDALDDELGETSQDCGGECGCRATYEDVGFKGVPSGIEYITFYGLSGDGSTIVGRAATDGDPTAVPITVSASGNVTFIENFGVAGSAEFVNTDGSIIAGSLDCSDPPECTNSDGPPLPFRWVDDAPPVRFPFDSPVQGMSASGNVVVNTEGAPDPDLVSRIVVSSGAQTFAPEMRSAHGISGNGAVVYGDSSTALLVWYTATDEIWTPPVPDEWSGTRQFTAVNADGSVFIGEGLVWIDITNPDYIPFIARDQTIELVDVVDDRLVDVRPRDVSADGARFVGAGYNEDTSTEEGVFWDEDGGARTLYDELIARGLEFPVDMPAVGPASYISNNGRIIVGGGVSGLLPFWRVVLSD